MSKHNLGLVLASLQRGHIVACHLGHIRRLETVPGVGPIVALTAIAVFADITRFGRSRSG